MALEARGLGLGFMLELPMLIIDVNVVALNRIAYKNRAVGLIPSNLRENGEAPIPVVAPKISSDCFNAEASKIATEYTISRYSLSDGYIANRDRTLAHMPNYEKLTKIKSPYISQEMKMYLPYQREKTFRKIAIPSTERKRHIIGGLEKRKY